MNIILWILQAVLAFVFVGHSRLMLASNPSLSPNMARGMKYVFDLSPSLRRFIGVCELLGSAGLILPALTSILPWLTPVAATGLALIMLLAAAFHLTRREYPNIVFNLILFALASFVAYGRFVLVPFTV